jgi:hypothetical protein
MPGRFYHVMARGNRRERIFCDQADRFLLARLSEFDLRADGSEAELDCRQTVDVQRCKCQPTSSPVPSAQIIQAASCFEGVSSICQDLLTDPYAYARTKNANRANKPRFICVCLYHCVFIVWTSKNCEIPVDASAPPKGTSKNLKVGECLDNVRLTLYTRRSCAGCFGFR